MFVIDWYAALCKLSTFVMDKVFVENVELEMPEELLDDVCINAVLFYNLHFQNDPIDFRNTPVVSLIHDIEA